MAPVAPRPSQACFMFYCVDGPDAAALRERDLEQHLAHVEAHWEHYLVAGPVREPDASAFAGSLFLVYARSLEEAWRLMRRDPYFTNGQYRSIEARPFAPSIGVAIGGKTWTDPESVRRRGAGPSPQS